MQAKITEAVQTALEGSRKVKITFKRDAIGDITYLIGMNRSGIIALTIGDVQALTCVMQTRKWDVDANRTLTVTLTDNFDEEWFVGRMRRALEKIEVVS